MMPWLAGRWGKSIACLDFSKVFDTASLKILRGWMRRWDANWLTGWWRSVAQSYLLIRTKNLQQCTCAFICLCILPFLSFHDYQLCGFMNLQQQRYLPLQSFISYCLRFLNVRAYQVLYFSVSVGSKGRITFHLIKEWPYPEKHCHCVMQIVSLSLKCYHSITEKRFIHLKIFDFMKIRYNRYNK